MIRKWQLGFEDRPYAGNRALEVLSKLYSIAEADGQVSVGANPCRGVSHLKEKKRARFASESELRTIFELLAQEKHKNPRGVAFLLLLLLTGSRPRALERARWDQLTRVGDSGLLRFEGKTSADSGEKETVVFPPQAMMILDQLPKREDGKILGRTIPIKLWHKIREKAGCKDLRARDLRRTFATIGLSNGVELSSIAELLNHRDTQTTKIYAKLMQGAKVNAATAVGNQMEKFMVTDKSESA